MKLVLISTHELVQLFLKKIKKFLFLAKTVGYIFIYHFHKSFVLYTLAFITFVVKHFDIFEILLLRLQF